MKRETQLAAVLARLITLIARALVVGGSKPDQKRRGLEVISMTSTERSVPVSLLRDLYP